MSFMILHRFIDVETESQGHPMNCSKWHGFFFKVELRGTPVLLSSVQGGLESRTRSGVWASFSPSSKECL